MFEVERQAYLKALGIVQYVPKEPIPGALESPVLDEQDIWPPRQNWQPPAGDAGFDSGFDKGSDTGAASPEPGIATSETTAVSRPVPAQPVESHPVSQADPGVLSSDGIKVNIPAEHLSEGPATPQGSQANSKPRQAASPEVEFCFALVQTSSGMAILSELGDPGVKDMSAQEHRLMNDVLQALQLPLDACRYQYFKWPLVNNPRIKQGWPEARETLTAYLDEKLAGAGISSLLVLGSQPVEALGLSNQSLQLKAGAPVTVQAPALHAMLADWRHKSRAWRMLAPLRGRHV